MKVIDLSTEIYTGMEVYPGDPDVSVEIVNTIERENWELRYLKLGSHTGTHVDAFSHMHVGMRTIDEIPIENFFGTAQVVGIDDDWATEIGLFFLEEMTITDFERIVDSKPRFVGGNIDEELERKLLGIGIITYTGLVNLDKIPRNTHFMFYGLPLKIRSGDGSPVRAIAIIE